MKKRLKSKLTVFLPVLVILFASGCAVGRRPASEKPSGESFRNYFERGVTLFNRGEFSGAASALSRALSIYPGSAVAHNLLGICLFQRKEYPAARIHFEKATAADPQYAQAFNNLASAYFMQGDYDRSEASFKKALEIKPDLASALYSLGNLYLSRERTDEGLILLTKAIAVDPDYLETHQALITQSAQEGFRSTEAYFLYARLYAQAGNIAKTVSYLEKAEGAGFTDWRRVLSDAAFDKVRDAPLLQTFMRVRLGF